MEPIFNIPFKGIIQRTFINYDSVRGKFKSDYISSSIVSNFIPYHALLSGKLLTNGSNKALLYSLDVPVYVDYTPTSYEAFFTNLLSGGVWNKLNKKNIESDYRCRIGQLVQIVENTVVPLVVLVVNREHVFSINKENPDLSKFFVVISTQFSESKKHSNLYKNFCKQYLAFAMKKVDIIYTRDIENFCYKQIPITPIKPKTIAESKTMYQSLTFDLISTMDISNY